MKTIFGIQKGMTQVFDEKGNPTPVTVVEVAPLEVVQIKTLEKDGYSALKVGFGKKKKVIKPIAGQAKGKNFRFLEEVKIDTEEGNELGNIINAGIFEQGDKVKITGVSKGRGFAGTTKRHNFSRGPVSHGHPFSRKPGSIGSMFPQRVMKGMRMCGRMGGKNVTVSGITVFSVDVDKNLILLKGAVPGSINSKIRIVKNA